MAKVRELTISFPASDSPDVVGYKLYMEEFPIAVTYESPSFDLGNNTTVNVAALEGMTTKDGFYNFGVTAVDDAGNESSMSTVDNVPLDFEAPNPPGPITITHL